MSNEYRNVARGVWVEWNGAGAASGIAKVSPGSDPDLGSTSISWEGRTAALFCFCDFDAAKLSAVSVR